MFNIILYKPQIPANTGNIIRLCANTGSSLHIIEPMGFFLNDKKLQRAGLDYHEYANIKTYLNIQSCLKENNFNNLYLLTSKGFSNFYDKTYNLNDAFIFGNEIFGCEDEVYKFILKNNQIKIPMLKNSRCLNLSNTVSIVVFEAWRQNNFINGII